MSTSAGVLTIDIEARVARLEEGMTKAARSVKKTSDDIGRSLSVVKNGFAAIVSAAGIGAFLKSVVESGERVDDLSQRLGVSASRLSAYEFAAKMGGTSTEVLSSALTKLSVSMQDAVSNKGSQAAKVFASLGVSVTDTSGKVKSLDKVFEELSARIARAPDGTEKVAAIRTLAGRVGAELIPTMNALAETTAEAERLGFVVSDKFAKQAGQFGDSMDRLKSGVMKFGRAIVSDLLPGLTQFIDRINVAIGAQEQLSLDTLERDRAALMRHYLMLRQSGMQTTWAEAKELEKRLHALDAQIIASNKRLTALRGQKAQDKPLNMPGGTSADDGLDKVAEALKKQVDPVYELTAAMALYDQLLDKNKITTGQWADATIAANEKFRKAIGDNQEAQSMLIEGAPKDDGMAARLAQFDQSLMLENERFAEDYAQKALMLEEFYQNSAMTDEEYAQRKLALDEWRERESLAIAERSMSAQEKLWRSGLQGRLQVAGQILGQVSDLMQSKSKKAFEVGKAAAIAETIISTYVGAQKAFSALASFPPAAYAAAAAAIASGFVRVQAIRSQQFGGGGGAPGTSGTYSASPNTGQPTAPVGLPPSSEQRSGSQIQVVIQGNVLTQDFVRDQVAPVLSGLVNNGDVVIIDANSRQAQEIRA